MQNIITLVILLFLYGTVNCQKFCGTKDTEFEVWDNNLKKLGIDRNPTNTLKSGNTFWVPMHYHVMRKSNGTGQYYQYWVLIMNCELNQAYSKSNIKFYIDTISYHNIDEYYKVSYGEDVLLSDYLSTKMHCNVYLTDDPAGNCGYTRRPSGKTPETRFPIFLAASATNIACCSPGGKTLPHEMGHWLDLPHTFFHWEGLTYNNPDALDERYREVVPRKGDSANCAWAGDGFCDTEPDYISDRWNCPNNKIFTDPLGNKFTAVGWNFMSYADDACISSTNGFSLGQINVMNFCQKYPDRRDLYELAPPIDKYADSISGVLPISDINIKLIKKNFKIAFNKQDGADFFQITVAKGNAVLNSNYMFPQSQQSSFIVDTIISADNNYIDIPESKFNSTAGEYYYYRVIPFSKTNTCPSNIMQANFFRLSNLEIDINVNQISCGGKEDGGIELINSKNIQGLTYKFNGTLFNGKIDNLKSGNYLVQVIEGNGNISELVVVISDYGKAQYKLNKNSQSFYIIAENGKKPYSYKWSNGSNLNFVNINSGVTSVTVTDAYACDSTVFKISTSSINSLGLMQNMNLYPNPVKLGDKIMIKATEVVFTSGTIEIFDILGNKLYSSYFNNSNQVLNNFLPWTPTQKGVYFIELKTNKNEFRDKIKIE